MIKEHDLVALCEDLPEFGLQRGDVGVVVMTHAQGQAYEVEFTTLQGETIAIVTLSTQQIRPVDPREIAHARALIAS